MKLFFMARATNKHSSKRRATALKFLSTISFDASYCQKDTASELTHLNDKPDCLRISSSTSKVTTDIVNEVRISRYIDNQSSKSSYTSFRDRRNTGGRDLKQRREMQRKQTDEYPFPVSNSSSESIASGIGGSKSKVDSNVKLQKLREVKVVRSSYLRNYRNERIMLVSPTSKIPFYIFSFIPYKKMKRKNESKKDSVGRRRNLSATRPLSSFMDTLDPFLLLGLEKHQDAQMISYQQLLLPTFPTVEEKDSMCQQIDSSLTETTCVKNIHISRCVSVDLGAQIKSHVLPSSSPPFSEFRVTDWDEFVRNSNQESYSPFLLDDPELMSGKHRTVLTFPSYRASIIDYVRPTDLKKELNEKFREKFPYVQLSLSKLRSLKRDMKKLSKNEKCVDLLTVAQAYVYFEKLILRNVINKTNRKLCAAVCLLLSAKMNDTRGLTLKQLLEKLESVFRLSRKDVLSLEFAVVVALEFNLHVPTWVILPHYQRLVYES